MGDKNKTRKTAENADNTQETAEDIKKIQEISDEDQLKIMFVGRSRAGKTTLCQYLNNMDIEYHKTQTVQVFNNNMIDTPGEYLERRYFRAPLVVTANDADVLIFTQPANEKITFFSPGYNSNFPKPCIGVVTKADLADEKQLDHAVQYLKMAGAQPIFITSAYEGTGIKEFMDYLEVLQAEKIEKNKKRKEKGKM